MNRSLLALASILVVGACAEVEPPAAQAKKFPGPWPAPVEGPDAGVPACPSSAATCVEVAPAPPVAGACPDDRWIAVLASPAPSCPEPAPRPQGRWRGRPLFASVATGPGWNTAPGLRDFCVYTWEPAGTAPTAAVVSALDEIDPLLAGRGPDCRVVVPSGSAATDTDWQELRGHYHGQLDRLTSLPGPTPAPVRVAIADTMARGPGLRADQAGHGRTVAAAIAELACPDPADPTTVCAETWSHLALPLDASGKPAPTTGGFYGRQSDVAVAIVDAVNAWRKASFLASKTGAAGPERLVVNLSVAWDPRWGGEIPGPSPTSLPPAVRSVHHAIVHARCFGALVIAAAGNDPGGPGEASDAMFPAAWETEPAPEPAACASFEGPGYASGVKHPIHAAPGTYDPLIVAVGGVRADDRPLPSARTGGVPRLVAPASHAVAEDRLTGGPTDVLTGSSMAAAAVSGIAAAVWSYRPSLAPGELAAHLHASGVDLGAAADVCLGGAPCPLPGTHPQRRIRRVALCAAVHAACTGAAALTERCPDPALLSVCATPAAHAGTVPSLSVDARAAIATGVLADAVTVDVALPALPVCGHDAYFATSDAAYPATTCPGAQYHTTASLPWSGPQPPKTPCPLCQLDVDGATGHGTLHVSIDTSYVGYDLTNMTLSIDGYGELDLSAVGTLTGGDELVVERIPIAGSGFRTATLAFRTAIYAHDYSLSSDVLVIE